MQKRQAAGFGVGLASTFVFSKLARRLAPGWQKGDEMPATGDAEAALGLASGRARTIPRCPKAGARSRRSR
jgi:hypothetical protein